VDYRAHRTTELRATGYGSAESLSHRAAGPLERRVLGPTARWEPAGPAQPTGGCGGELWLLGLLGVDYGQVLGQQGGDRVLADGQLGHE
jgi:hypothetical protein